MLMVLRCRLWRQGSEGGVGQPILMHTTLTTTSTVQSNYVKLLAKLELSALTSSLCLFLVLAVQVISTAQCLLWGVFVVFAHLFHCYAEQSAILPLQH